MVVSLLITFENLPWAVAPQTVSMTMGAVLKALSHWRH